MRCDNSNPSHPVYSGESLSDVLDWLSTTKSAWKGRLASMDADPSFYGTANMSEAITLATGGWSDGCAMITKGMDAAAMLKPAKPVQTMSYDIGGAYPDVGLYCAGVADHMVCLDPDANQTRPIYRFVIGMFTSCGTSAAAITNRGAAILSWVDKLEAEGARVEIMSALLIRDGNKRLSLGFTVKRADEPLELDRLAFVLAHPSMYRRIGFAAIERSELETPFGFGYGMACDEMPKAWQAPNSVYFPCMSGNSSYGTMAGAMALVEATIKGAITQPLAA